MFIELSEALACPDCGPPQGLVVVVDRIDGSRVLEGFLGCPICEARFPIRHGVVELAGDADDTAAVPAAAASEDAAVAAGDASTEQPDPALAEMIAALFDLRDGRGYILLDEALESAAAKVAELTGGCEAIALATDPGEGPPPPGTNRVTGVGPMLPVQTGRLRALALGAANEPRLGEAVRALGPEGRLVVVRPGDAIRKALLELPVQPLADEPIAFLGVVAPGG